MLSKDAGSLQIVYARNSVYVFMGNRDVGGSHWIYVIEVYYGFKRKIKKILILKIICYKIL